MAKPKNTRRTKPKADPPVVIESIREYGPDLMITIEDNLQKTSVFSAPSIVKHYVNGRQVKPEEYGLVVLTLQLGSQERLA